jgi:hypothetical protein
MARNKQPYLPLYVQDWLSNFKLRQTTMQAHGLMINLMCVMHKEDDYGRILLKQKFKQTDKQTLNFASQLAKILPFTETEIEMYLDELIEENILLLEGDFIICDRMIRDANLSKTRALAGKSGGKSTQSQNKETTSFASPVASDFALAKFKANAENENENENDNILIENNIFGKCENLFANLPKDSHLPCNKLADVYGKDEKLLNAVSKSTGKSVAYLQAQLPAFVDHLASLSRSIETPSEFAKYFRNAMKMAKQPEWVIGVATSVPTVDYYVWSWRGQAAKKGSKAQYEADKRNFGMFDFVTVKTPANA